MSSVPQWSTLTGSAHGNPLPSASRRKIRGGELYRSRSLTCPANPDSLCLTNSETWRCARRREPQTSRIAEEAFGGGGRRGVRGGGGRRQGVAAHSRRSLVVRRAAAAAVGVEGAGDAAGNLREGRGQRVAGGAERVREPASKFFFFVEVFFFSFKANRSC